LCAALTDCEREEERESAKPSTGREGRGGRAAERGREREREGECW